MSKYSEFLKEMKENQINKFFGEVKKTSNKYFKFDHILNLNHSCNWKYKIYKR